MRSWLVTLGACICMIGGAPAAASLRAVDLRDAANIERLRQSNPAHYAVIRQILTSLHEHPERAETQWLQTTYDAHDVELSRMLLKTSLPPRQLLRFTLDQTRYTLHVTRSDLAEPFMGQLPGISVR